MQKATIFFDPVEHKYTDENNNVYTSVTTLLDKYKPKYDAEFWAMYRALDQTGYKLKPDPERRRIFVQGAGVVGQWYSLSVLFTGIIHTHKTPKQINAEWRAGAEEACHYGTEKHNTLEAGIQSLYIESTQAVQITSDLYDYKIETHQDLDNYDIAHIHPSILNVLSDLLNKGYILYAEHRVYSVEHLVSGTIDLLAINDKNEFVIVDWKTNKDQLKWESGYYKKEWNAERTHKINTNKWVKTKDNLLAPLQKLCNSKGTLYSLQLALYALICELWGYTHKLNCIVHIRRKVTNMGQPIFKDDGTHDFEDPLFYHLQPDAYRDYAKLILNNQLKLNSNANRIE